jgi:Tfp pilus assembly protein PilO
MSRSVEGAERRARQATADAAAADTELRAVSAARDGRDAAVRELAIFYRDVLPADVAAARRVLQLKLAQLARTHRVTFARSTATPEAVRESTLARLKVTADLVGRYDDIRAFLYALETAGDFVVVESIVLAEGDDARAPLSLTLDVATYYRTAADVR